MGFKTSVLGFHKADVLACIDRMSAEHLKAQEKAESEVKTLEDALAVLRTEQEALAEKDVTQSEEILLLQQAIIKQQSLVVRAEDLSQSLEKELVTAKDAAHDYQARLFTKEGEITILRRDNTQLKQTITEQKIEMQQISDAAHEVCQQADLQIEEVRAQAKEDVAREKLRVDQKNEEMRHQMKASATDMAQEIVELKDALTVLDDKISLSLRDLQRSTQALTQALAATEQNVQSLGVKLEQFPKTVEKVSTFSKNDAVPQAVEVHPKITRKYSCKSPSISTLLLAKISKMIGEV